MNNITSDHVRKYWDDHPIVSYEKNFDNYRKYYSYFDKIKRYDIEKYAFQYWKFDDYSNKKVLDIGCGPGWYSVQYSKGGAKVYAIDISSITVELAKKISDHEGLAINIEQGNAEQLDFPDNYFDLVISNGVLHHTPDYIKAINETFRVLKFGGTANLTFYRKGILHNPVVWPILRLIIKVMKIKHPGSDFSVSAKNVDDFIRQYDGYSNPVGIGKKNKTWAKLLEETGYQIKKIENHFFPKRFMPFNKYIPDFVHMILDKFFGTMVYFSLIKR